jgi:uncharacterized protein
MISMHLRQTVTAFAVSLALLAAGCGSKPAAAPAMTTPADKSQATPAPDTGGAKKQLVVGATASSSGYYVYYVSVAKAINQYVPNLNATVVETGATVDNLKRMAKGQVDIGLTTAETLALNYAGAGPYKDAANPKLRVLMVYSDIPQSYMVREDSGVTKFADLAGKPFNSGLNGSATELTTDMLLNGLNIKTNAVKGSTGDITAAIKDRRVIGFGKTGWQDPSILDLMATTKLRFLSFSPEEEAAAKKVLPPGVVWMDIPKDTYKGIPAYRTFGLVFATGATTDLSEQDAYNILKSHDQGMKEIAAAFKDVDGQDVWKLTVDQAPIYLHAGTVKFLKEKGIKVPDNLIPPEAKK